MEKYILFFFAGLSFLSTPLSFAGYNNTLPLRSIEKRPRLLTAYITSLIVSGGIGAVTGGVLRHLEKKFETCPVVLFLTLLGWALESELRNDIIIALQKDLDNYGITYKKGLMFKGAWIASWISYLHAMK